MIVPWLKGMIHWTRAPVTWTLLVLNLLIFLQTQEVNRASVTSSFSNVETMVFTGKLYFQFQNPETKSLPLNNQNQWIILGGQALRDPQFIERVPQFHFFGDEIAIDKWKKEIVTYQNQMQERNIHLFGLNSQNASPLSWVTYQFMHASWMHLFSNMVMLLIFAAALELSVGSLNVIILYLLSGFAGAWAFLILSQGSLAPMIGASGSLSGLMAFYAAFEKKKRVSFFYFGLPLALLLASPQFLPLFLILTLLLTALFFTGRIPQSALFGWIYLPTFLILPLSFLPDLVGYLSTPKEIGAGVAYAAHIGGAIFGITLGYGFRYFRKHLWFRWLTHH
ncbi:MAG: rhomboid family intramembrane serine protease [Pseudobdellovibrionaceae bacterium]